MLYSRFAQEDLIHDIKNPTLKKVLVHFHKLRMMLSTVRGHGATVLLRNLVLEMFSCKLGGVVQIEEVDLATLPLFDYQKTRLRNILTAFSKECGESLANSRLHC